MQVNGYGQALVPQAARGRGSRHAIRALLLPCGRSDTGGTWCRIRGQGLMWPAPYPTAVAVVSPAPAGACPGTALPVLCHPTTVGGDARTTAVARPRTAVPPVRPAPPGAG